MNPRYKFNISRKPHESSVHRYCHIRLPGDLVHEAHLARVRNASGGVNFVGALTRPDGTFLGGTEFMSPRFIFGMEHKGISWHLIFVVYILLAFLTLIKNIINLLTTFICRFKDIFTSLILVIGLTSKLVRMRNVRTSRCQ